MDLREITPAYTTSSKLDESDSTSSCSVISTPTNTRPSTPSLQEFTINLESDDTAMQDLDPTPQDDDAIDPVDLNDNHPLQRFSISQNHPNHWSRHATIRHSDLVFFSFRHFAVPEDLNALEAYLKSLGGHEGIANAAKCLSELFEHADAVRLSVNEIYQLESLWTRKHA